MEVSEAIMVVRRVLLIVVISSQVGTDAEPSLMRPAIRKKMLTNISQMFSLRMF
jgi:hypothetical protein